MIALAGMCRVGKVREAAGRKLVLAAQRSWASAAWIACNSQKQHIFQQRTHISVHTFMH